MYKHVKFLFSCLGDLYGAIGSPVRLTRTVIVGKRKELVQRLLYVLTYFIRCSELQENQLTWSEVLGEGEQVLNGSKITTALEKGEVEESDYVVVTVKNEPALVPPILPPKSDGSKNNSIAGWVHNPEGTCTTTDSSKEKEAIGKVSQNSDTAVDCLTSTLHNGAADGRKRTVTDTGTGSYHFEEQSKLENLMDVRKNKNQNERKVEKQLSSRSSALPCPERSGHRSSQLEKVTFRIGSSASPESDLETQRREMEENLKAFRKNPEVVIHCASSSADLTVDVSQNQKESCEAAFLPFSKHSICYAQIPPCEGKESMLNNQHMETKGTEMNLGNTVSGELLLSTDNVETVTLPSLKETRTLCSGNPESYSPDCVEGGSAVRKESPKVGAKDVPYGDAGRKTPFRVEGDIPRNESSDSALGASDEEGDCCIPDEVHHDNVSKRLEEFVEVELPLPR